MEEIEDFEDFEEINCSDHVSVSSNSNDLQIQSFKTSNSIILHTSGVELCTEKDIKKITVARNVLLQKVLQQDLSQLEIRDQVSLAQLLTSTITQEQNNAFQSQNLEEKTKNERKQAFEALWKKILLGYILMAFVMLLRNTVRLRFDFWLGLLQHLLGEWSIWSNSGDVNIKTWLSSNWMLEKLLWWMAQNFMYVIIAMAVMVIVFVAMYLQANFKTIAAFVIVIYVACVSQEVLLGTLYWSLPIFLQLIIVYYSLHMFFALSEGYFAIENGRIICKHNSVSLLLNNSLFCFCAFLFVIYYMVSHCFSPSRIQTLLVLILTGEVY